MPISLSHFLRQQLAAQQLSEKGFAERSGVGLSHIYQILRGERKFVRGDTLDKIAAGLGMTPAEMAVAMGKGAPDADPEEAEAIALFRQVPNEKRPAAKDMLRGLAAQALPTAKTQAVGPANGLRRRRAEMLSGAEPEVEHERKRWQLPVRGVSTVVQHAMQGLLASLGLNRDSRHLTATA